MMGARHGAIGLVLLAICGVVSAVKELPESKEEVKNRESRIILRYQKSQTGQESLDSRVKRLESLPGISRAEALPSLDMAVVVCKTPEDEDDVLEALQTQQGVEVAVPDTWVQLDDLPKPPRGPTPQSTEMCDANPRCKAWGLQDACCPTRDGLWMECCDDRPPPIDKERHGFSTISLLSWHGGYLAAMRWGAVGFYPSMEHQDTRFFVVPHVDGYVSLKNQHGAYLVTTPSGRIACWHRGHGVADDFEKFKFIYNKDGSVSLRSKSSDKYLAAEHPKWGVATADREEIDDWEKFNVTTVHGWDTVIPNDESFEKLWGMNHFGGRDIDAVEAWRFFPAPPSNNVVVAVIDTGIDYTHQDLKERMWTNPNEIPDNGIDDDGNGIIDDVYGADFANDDGDPFDDQMHGTHCAGTIAGHGNNAEGVAGVAWVGVRLMALKFLSASGGGRTSDAIKCLNYAVAMGAKITSNSWGGGGSSSAMRVAIERAQRAGVMFIAAAGNEGSDNDAIPHYPSNYAPSNIISVASTTKTGSLSSFSCYGKESVDVAAPGSGIYSTVPGGKYASLSGTSMATPHVSGLAALIWLFRPQLTMPQIIEIILDSATREDALQNSSATGGRINARSALILASTYEGSRPPVHKPQALTFEDSDPGVGIMGGDAVITCAADESDISFYSIHLISGAGFLLDTIATVDATGAATLTVPLANLTLTKYAQGLAVVAGNATGSAGPDSAATARIKDYCVPLYGPSDVQWMGDADGRLGWVGGKIQFQRAESEKSLTHYNVYWHSAAGQGDLVGKVPTNGFSRPQCEVDCHLLDISVSGTTYTFHRGAYDNEELAKIHFSGPALMTITSFRTEKYYDFLEVGDRQLSGTKLALPMNIKLPSGLHTITWSSDRSEVEEGWTFHLTQTGTTADFEVPSMQPPSMELQVVAAFEETEGAAAAYGTLKDFDASVMAPSPALVARNLSFIDENVQEKLIKGRIQFFPPSMGADAVTFYHVYFADVDGIAQWTEYSWTLEAPKTAKEMLQIDLDLELPSAAVSIVAVSGNAHGEGAKTWIPLRDIVRSAPANASFSGDSDPVADQVRGDLTIVPAPVPTGVTSYAVYLGNGTKKDELLGQIPPSFEDISFSFHIRLESYQRSLIIVSAYDDFEMEEGVIVEFEDLVDDSTFFLLGTRSGRSLSEERSEPVEPWLRQPEMGWDERQLLWTEAPLATRQTKSGHAQAPHLMSSLLLPLAHGQSPAPSAELRRALRLALAEVLQVSLEQTSLTQGERLRCGQATAKVMGKSSRLQQPDERSCLLVNFHVMPDAQKALHPKLTQDFLDRIEAKVIRLHQGSTRKLDASLKHHLETLAPGTGAAMISEPQQMAPKERHRTGRGLAISKEEGVVLTTEEREETSEEPGYILVAVSIGAFLGALTVLVAARRGAFGVAKRSTATGEPDAVDPVTPADVSVQLSEGQQ